MLPSVVTAKPQHALPNPPLYEVMNTTRSFLKNPHSVYIKACFASGNTAKAIKGLIKGKTAKMHF